MLKVMMVISCFLPNGAELRQAWRIEKEVTLDHCIEMNRIFAQGGKAAVITVRCGGVRV